MKICVCIKPVDHLYARSGRDPRRHFVAPWDVVQRINPYDEAAMSMAVRLKHGLPDSQVLALTIGPVFAQEHLDRCLALGADHFFQIEPVDPPLGMPQPEPAMKAAWAAAAVRHLAASVVLCGKESLDRRNGLFGAFLAHRLGQPFVAGINGLRLSGRRHAEATQNAGRGLRRVMECSLPAVFSVEAGPTVAALAPHVARMRVGRKPVTRLLIANNRVTARTESIGVAPPKPRPRPVASPDNRLNGFERVGQLLTARRVEKQTQLVEGAPEHLADILMAYLRDNGHLPENAA